MAEIFRLEELFPENTLTKEENINFHKALSMGESFAKKNVKPHNCLICNSSKNPFCNSRSVPARCLRAIAINGEVKAFNGLVKIPAVDVDKGVNEAGTFRLICRKCDDEVFKDYETFEKYTDKTPSDKILHEIALKNYLKYYHKKAIEEIVFPKMMEILKLPNMNLLEPILNSGNRDKKDAFKLLCETKKILNSNTNGYYRIIEYKKLPYTCPFAFQGTISLITGFNGENINDVFNTDKKYDLQDMHVCIFPEKEYTYILVFIKKHFDRYSKFIKHYTSLKLEERLQVILFIILKYSEDYFYSSFIQDIDSNPIVHEAITSTSILICDYEDGDKDKINKSIKEYDLNKYKKLPNILAKEFVENMNKTGKIPQFKNHHDAATFDWED